MIVGVKIENGTSDHDHAILGLICHPKARIWYSLYVCNIWRSIVIGCVRLTDVSVIDMIRIYGIRDLKNLVCFLYAAYSPG